MRRTGGSITATRALNLEAAVAAAFMLCSLMVVTVPNQVEAESAVLSQNILLDPVRPVIYWAGADGNDLRFINSSTGDIIDTTILGAGPSSICLSPDGTVLYVAIPSFNCILTVDTNSHSVTGNISLTFSPRSIKLDGGNFMYISGAGDDSANISSVNTGTWKVRNTVQPGIFATFIEVSPDGSTLLAFETGISPVKICRYGVNSGVFTPLDIDNQDLGSYLRNEVVDWARDKIYLACGYPYGIQVVSIATLDNLGTYPMDAYPSCVAMSNDGRYLYGIHDSIYGGSLWMFNATDGSIMGSISVGSSVNNLAISHDLRSAFIGPPMRRIALTPNIEPLYPASTEIYGYTPSYFSMRFGGGLSLFEAWNANATLDDNPLPLYFYEADGYWYYYRADFNQTLAEGVHFLNISLPWLGQKIWDNSTFTIDRSSPLALKPTLYPNAPLSDSIRRDIPLSISAWIVYPYSDWPAQGGWILLDNLNLSTTFNPQMLSATSDVPSLGWHNISACVYWDGGLGKSWTNWSFLVMQGPLMTPVFPAASQVLTEMPDHIEVALDPRDAEGNVSAPQFYLDGNPLQTVLTANGTMRAEITSTIKSGIHRVQATLNWVAGKASMTWEFELDMFVGPRGELLVRHEYKDEFSMLVPSGSSWVLEEDSEISGEIFPLVMYGPMIGNFNTNIIVQSGRDSAVEESEAYLEEQLDIALDELRESGLDVNLLWVPGLRQIDNHTAYVATIELVGYGVYQEFAIIASEEHEMVWVIILSISTTEFNAYSGMFYDMVDSFDIEMEPASGSSSLGQAAIGLGLAAVAGAAVGAVVWLTRKRRGPAGPRQP